MVSVVLQIPSSMMGNVEAEEPTENKTVVMELFTETWCGPCKNADLATDELREDYSTDDLLILEYHYDQSGDPFFTDETNYRFNQYYSFNSWPSAMFDGTREEVGSGSVKEVRDRYNEHIQAQLQEQSHFSITILDPSYSSNNGYVRAYIAERSDSERRNLTVNTVIYRDRLQYDGGNGITDHRYVVREMFAEPLALPTDVVEYNFTLPNDSQYFEFGDNVGIVIFIQDDDTKEILQAETHAFFTQETKEDDNEGSDENDGQNILIENPMIPVGIMSLALIAGLLLIMRSRKNEVRAMSEIRKREEHAVSQGGVRNHPGGLSGRKVIPGKSSKPIHTHGKGRGPDIEDFTMCPECGTRLKKKNLDSHRDRVHAISK